MSNSESRTPSQALEDLGLTLPAVAAPVAAYVPATRTGNLVFTSGQLPFVNGELTHVGHVGAEVTAEEAKEAARTCALNALAAVDAEVGLDNVTRIVKVGDVFGERGQHARSAVGVNQLPLDAPVEVEIIVEVTQ